MEPSLLKDSILTTIKEKKVCPRAKGWYVGREFLLWLLWIVTVSVGALALTISMYVLMEHYAASGLVARHAGLLTQAVPYLWLLLAVLAVSLSVLNLRHTKKGYRFTFTATAVGSVLLSAAFGSFLHSFGAGMMLDHQFGVVSSLYTSQDKLERTLWQRPLEGRLVGVVTTSTFPYGEPSKTEVLLTDPAGVVWRVNIADVVETDQRYIMPGRQVRVIGAVESEIPAYFHACAVALGSREGTRSVRDFMAMRRHMRDCLEQRLP